MPETPPQSLPSQPAPAHAPPPRGRIAGVLGLAILGISVSGPLAKLSAAPPLAIAVWRLLLSLLIVAVPLLAGGSWRELRGLTRRDVAIALGAGTFLALHFWSWIASLGMTSVAASVLLVNLHPVVFVVGGAFWLGEPATRAQLVGVGLAMLGAVLVAVGPELRAVAAPVAAERAMLGNGLALAGALSVGLYYLAGRRLRQKLSLWPYVALVYGACLAVLLALAAWQRTPLWPQPSRELGIFALIALGPMLAGHTGFNWALRYVPGVVISVALLAEPVGAGVIAWLAFGEVPSASTLLGGAVVLLGLAVVARGERAAS